jgi:hypothetical protein
MERKRVLRKVQITVTTNYDFSPGRIRKIMQGTRFELADLYRTRPSILRR